MTLPALFPMMRKSINNGDTKMHAHTFTLAVVAILASWGAAALVAYGIQAWRAARRRVIGTRVKAPEWRARRLTNGQWIVERNRS